MAQRRAQGKLRNETFRLPIPRSLLLEATGEISTSPREGPETGQLLPPKNTRTRPRAVLISLSYRMIDFSYSQNRLARARQTYSGKVHSHRPLVFARAGEATEGIRHVE